MKRWVGRWVAGVLLAASVAAPVRAEEHAAITYVGAVATSIFYLPVKVTYAALGGLVGGLALLATGGNADAFFAVWDPAAGGDYVVTPAMLEGTQDVQFVGRSES